jgi:hypothetical protein
MITLIDRTHQGVAIRGDNDTSLVLLHDVTVTLMQKSIEITLFKENNV